MNQPWSRDVFVLLDDVVTGKWDLCERDLIYLFLVMRVVFKAQPSYFVSKKIGGNSTVVTTEVGFKLSEYYGISR